MTPASYWKQVREACDKKSPGEWWLDEHNGAIRCDTGHVSDNDFDEGNEEFVLTASVALPLALARIEELEAALESSRVSFHDQYCDVNRIRSPHGPCNCWCNEHNARIDAALGKP
jgi:hypothetical protein